MADSITTGSLPPRIFILLENPKKSNNLGPILRCAAAFSTAQIVAVGYDKCSTHGSHGAAKHVDIVAFPVLEQAVEYLRAPLGSGGCGCVSIVGLVCGAPEAYRDGGHCVYKDESDLIRVATGSEASDGQFAKSYPSYSRHIYSSRHRGNFCFAIGKRKEGLPSSLASACDSFVHVPHTPATSSALCYLDVQSCLSITLHHFAAWAQYSERTFDGHKFQVAFVQKGRLQSAVRNQQQDAANERRVRKEDLAAEEMSLQGATYGDVFGTGAGDGDY